MLCLKFEIQPLLIFMMVYSFILPNDSSSSHREDGASYKHTRLRGRHRLGEAPRGRVSSVWEAKENWPKKRSFGLGFKASIAVYQVEK